jgi:hypothetical protein
MRAALEFTVTLPVLFDYKIIVLNGMTLTERSFA